MRERQRSRKEAKRKRKKKKMKQSGEVWQRSEGEEFDDSD